jgi:hypothetical protein
MRRVGRPGLIGTMARTAVIAGTASAVTGGVAKMQGYGPQPTPPQPPQPQPQPTPAPAAAAPVAAAPPPPESTGMSVEAMDQLKKLAELHEAGVLTDEEFAAQKARILH